MEKRLRFLLVDDDPIFLAIAESVVGSLGEHEIKTAQSGTEGMARLQQAQGQFDVIILDLNMPDLDGLALMRSIGATGFRGGVLISSGEAEAVLRSARHMGELLKVKILGTLKKPLTPQGLQAALIEAERVVGDAPQSVKFAVDLSLNNLELIPYYQAQHDSHSGRIEGLESLIRVRAPDGQIHGPGKLFGLIHRHEDLFKTTIDIAEKVLADLSHWQALGITPRTSINMDARIAEDPALIRQLLALCDRFAVRPRQLCLELTETALPHDMSRLVESLTRLRIAGFELSIDDYGTGTSNFELLRLCPFSELKLDGTVIRSAATEAAARHFTEATVNIADNLGLTLVAEGVETAEQLGFVQSSGIPIVQGYLFSRPMPAGNMLALLSEQDASTRRAAS